MLDLFDLSPTVHPSMHPAVQPNLQPATPATAAPAAPRWFGVERRADRGGAQAWLMAMLDEVGYPLILLTGRDEVSVANRAALRELDEGQVLQMAGRQLRTRAAADQSVLREALIQARERGLRRLVSLGSGEPAASAGGDAEGDGEGARLCVAVIPLSATAPAPGSDAAVLLAMGRRQPCESLTVDCFARDHGLTLAEAAVLQGLCQGQRPQEIAQAHGVALSTVRSQVGSIRAKTGATSIRHLVQQVSLLPPLLGVLGRRAGPGREAWQRPS